MCETRKSSLWGKITVVLVICFFVLPAHAKYGGGSGTAEYPYLIYNADQMNAIGADPNDWDKCFILMADINLSQFDGKDGREKFNVIGIDHDYAFTGVFDGNDNTISNFTYYFNGVDYIGLFGYINDPNAEVKDLGLIDPNVDVGTGSYIGSLVGRLWDGTISGCYVEGGSVVGEWYVGGLVGRNNGTVTNCSSEAVVLGDSAVGGLVGEDGLCSPLECFGGTISNCYSTGSVTGDYYIGGLVGNNHGTITNCYATGSITGERLVGGLLGLNSGTITNCYSTASVSGDWRVGGLVGHNSYGTITDCYSTGGVSGDENVGGLAGRNYRGTITNCYSVGNVDGNDWVGGLVGYKEGDITNSFWDIETSGQDLSDGGTGKTTAEMQTMSTFTDAGWDFITPFWTIDEGVDYPRLWWEFVPVLHAEPEVTLGTSNTISWEPVIGGVEYYAECAEDANFTSIIYNSGWITETSCEFTGLEFGQRYWYSVKTRNTAGIESDWSNVEWSMQGTLADAVDIMLDPNSLKNENMKNALLNKIDEVLDMIDEGLYTNALSKLENDILAKMNGCGETGEPDKNDWIITCDAQDLIYPLVIETIEHVRILIE